MNFFYLYLLESRNMLGQVSDHLTKNLHVTLTLNTYIKHKN